MEVEVCREFSKKIRERYEVSEKTGENGYVRICLNSRIKQDFEDFEALFNATYVELGVVTSFLSEEVQLQPLTGHVFKDRYGDWCKLYFELYNKFTYKPKKSSWFSKFKALSKKI